MRLLTPDQSSRLDRRTFENPRFSSEDFIEKAGRQVFEKIQLLGWAQKSTLILAGPGHNGDDARVVHRLLLKKNKNVRLWTLRDPLPDISSFELVVDGLFGVGLRRPLEGAALQLVQALNSVRKARRLSTNPLCVIAVDVPSGLDALTGWPLGIAVQADHTVTMQAAKPGFFQNEGPRHCGRIHIAPLPYPTALFREIASTHFACGLRAASKLLPRRSNLSNKGSFGVVNVVAGSAKYPGAGVLCARAALRTGAGYVRLIQFEDVYPDWFQIPETLFQKWEKVPSELEAGPAWVIGPGLSDTKKIRDLIENLLACGCEKVILDASALDIVAEMKRTLPESWLLTPHPKELARMLGASVEDIQRNRFDSAVRAHEKWGATILLKGYKTIVYHRGRHFISLRGHSALAKAGSGDVLAGMIGSYLAQRLETGSAAMTATLVHAIAADEWLKEGDTSSLGPSDLIEMIPSVQKKIKRSQY
jgi:NAD(P)H-hydrate epimerase